MDLPDNHIFLFFHHSSELCEDGAKLNDGLMDAVHGVRSTLDVRILQEVHKK